MLDMAGRGQENGRPDGAAAVFYRGTKTPQPGIHTLWFGCVMTLAARGAMVFVAAIPYHAQLPAIPASTADLDPAHRENGMKRWMGAAAAGMLTAGCAGMMANGPSATATLEPTRGNTTAGKVEFVQKGDKVFVTARVSGLTPGSHGFHIHEKGDCSSGDGASAGGHFNPLGKPHAAPTTMDRHAGDMPMLVADGYGNATLSAELDVVTVGGGGATDVVGRSIIVHKDADDYRTQPTGNSGARLACGVIRKS
jgi:Cu-Zn family superoxide dismutase